MIGRSVSWRDLIIGTILAAVINLIFENIFGGIAILQNKKSWTDLTVLHLGSRETGEECSDCWWQWLICTNWWFSLGKSANSSWKPAHWYNHQETEAFESFSAMKIDENGTCRSIITKKYDFLKSDFSNKQEQGENGTNIPAQTTRKQLISPTKGGSAPEYKFIVIRPVRPICYERDTQICCYHQHTCNIVSSQSRRVPN